MFLQTIDNLQNYASSIANKVIPKKVIINSYLFHISMLSGMGRLRINDKFINHFGVTFAPTGFGKDLSLKVAETNNNFIKNYQETIDRLFIDYGLINIEDPDFIVPNSHYIPLQGTIEGIMRTGNFFNELPVGSLNVVEQEFGSIFNKEILNFIVKMYEDGTDLGAVTVNKKYKGIKDVPMNILLFGSLEPFERDKDLFNRFTQLLHSGLARRSIFLLVEKEDINFFNESHSFEFDNEIYEFVRELVNTDKRNLSTKNIDKFIDEYNRELIEKYNKEKTDINLLKLSNRAKLIRLIGLISVANKKFEPTIEEFNIALSIINKSDNDLEKVLRPKQPYKKMFDYLKIKKSSFVTEMIDELGLNINKTQAKEQIEMLEEYAYIKNYSLAQSNKMLHLLPLKENTLNEIILSYNKEGKQEKGVTSKSVKFPFFGSNIKSLEYVVTSDVDWFSLVHYNGNRSIKNVIPEFNCIGLDIDELLTLDEARDKCFVHTNLIYTTRNHKKEKNGIIEDRFRILIPLSHLVHINVDNYKEFIMNIVEYLGLENYIDYSTVEPSRLWFPNPNAQIYKNTNELLDPTWFIPNTDKQKQLKPVINRIKDIQHSNKRIEGITKWAVLNATVGSRNNTLFRACMLIKDLGGDAENEVLRINNMLAEPLSEREIERTIFKTLRRK